VQQPRPHFLIDYSAASRTPHEWENCASYLEHTNEVDLDDLLPFGSFEFVEGLVGTQISRTVYKDIDSQRLTDGRGKSLCDLIGVRNIDAQGMCAVEFARIDIPNPYLSTRSTKRLATALPIPLAPPVTTAVWPEKSYCGPWFMQFSTGNLFSITFSNNSVVDASTRGMGFQNAVLGDLGESTVFLLAD
jgi:hypothetical protein